MSISTKERRAAELRAQRDALNAQIAAAEEDLRQAHQARVEEPPPGSRVMLEATFPGSPGQVYTYLALRTDNRRPFGANWYVTGQKGKLTWDEVLNLVERGDYQVSYLTFRR